MWHIIADRVDHPITKNLLCTTVQQGYRRTWSKQFGEDRWEAIHGGVEWKLIFYQQRSLRR